MLYIYTSGLSEPGMVSDAITGDGLSISGEAPMIAVPDVGVRWQSRASTGTC